MRTLTSLTLLFLLAPLAFSVAPPTPTHWAFRTPRRPAIPISHNAHNTQVSQPATLSTPVDAFLIAKLQNAGRTYSPPADRTTLLRRLTFDLIGLPPTPEEVAAFLADTRPDAYPRVVERLLADPRHGERWAQHWLDVARYAETNGYELDAERPQSWRYRDWVVAALNADLPYNRFLTQQLAGDLLARKLPANSPEVADLQIAAGFNRCGPIHQVSGNIDPLEVRHELLNEMTTGLGAAFLGLTLGCARCHDHKFDPISQVDYFQLEAFFSAARMKEADLSSTVERVRYAQEFTKIQVKILQIKSQVSGIELPYRDRILAQKHKNLEPQYRAALAVPSVKRTPEQRRLVAEANILLKISWDEVVAVLSPEDAVKRSALRRRMHELQAQSPAPPISAWTIEEAREPLTAHVLKRGDFHKRGARVQPGFPQIFASTRVPAPGNRIALANWLTRPDHPLTARVLVNRLWQHHFGKGLVRTPNDFGLRGEPPTHPELLDWLAVELIESGWSLRHIHRLIVLSTAYQQSGKAPQTNSSDPENRLLGHFNRRRLDAESLRDSVLSVSGQLTPKLGGPMVRVPLEPEVYDLIFTEDEPDGLWPVSPDPREHTRRSLYLFNKRTVRLPILETFDQPDALTSCSVRSISTFAPQALILLNSPFMRQQAGAFAVRLHRECGPNPARQITRAHQLTLGRNPRKADLETALAFLSSQTDLLRDALRAREKVALPDSLPDDADPAQLAALADYCLALLNRNAFVHVE